MANHLKEMYEVFRIISGIPLFLEDHIQRLIKGANNTGIILNKTYNDSIEEIKSFVKTSNITEGNIKLSVYFDFFTGKEVSREIRFIPAQYPSEDMYAKGVKSKLMASERINPQTKIANTEVRTQANKYITEHNIYEVLLVNHRGEITEGSRSNVFFVRKNTLYTAPDSMVLPGIVRKKVIELAQKSKIIIEFVAINAEKELKKMEAAFISGTSPGILPLKCIENYKLHPDHIIFKQLLNGYQQLVNNYLSTNKI